MLLPAICTLVVILTNLLVAVQFRGRRIRAVVTSILAAAILLAAGEYLPHEPAKPMSSRLLAKFGIEGEDLVTLFIDPRGSEMVRRLGIPVQSDAGGLHVDNVQVLSRLGAEYFVRLGDRSFTLPKWTVFSWQRNDQGKR